MTVAQRLRQVPRLVYILAAIFLAVGPIISPVISSQVAEAALVCTNDTQGANDDPGQKDLTRLCIDTANSPTSYNVQWNWDELGTPGVGQSLDACALFDTDGDGNINFAACVTTKNNPATLFNTGIYTCGDAKVDRCTTPANLVVGPYSTNCSVSQQATQPFPAGAGAGSDTVANCTIYLSEVGGTGTQLVDVCSFPSQNPNSDPSDCIIIAPKKGKLEVRKDLEPNSDPGLFNLKINNVTYATDVGDGGTTGEVVVNETSQQNSNSVSETPDTGTLLTNYTTSIVCKDQNGTGITVASSTPTGTTSRSLTVPVADGTDVVCVITNTRISATLTVVKTVDNDNGGTLEASDFPLFINGNPVTSGQSNTLLPGSYTVSETNQPGYEAGTWGGDCNADGTITLAGSQNATCTITNSDMPSSLIVTKEVTNDDGGDAESGDFSLFVNGNSITSGQPVDNVVAGTEYTITEGSVAGYSLEDIVCTDTDTQQTVSHPVTLDLGQNVSCVITNNDDAPTLDITKHVINNNGGTIMSSDFKLYVNGTMLTDPYKGGGEVEDNGATYRLPNAQANTAYTVSEDPETGYSQTSLNCVDDDTQQSVSNPVTLSEGQKVTCTISNNDIAPKLTVVKTVDNGQSGSTLDVSDFPLYVGTTEVVSGVENEFNAGNYTVSEDNQPGYSASDWGTNCLANGSITLVVGGVYTCTITNTAIPGQIIVNKVVETNHGGEADEDDFALFVNNTEVTDEATNTFPVGQYEITESSSYGSQYEQTSLECINTKTQQSVGHPFSLGLDQTIECTITNEDVAPNLTLNKVVNNDNGGEAEVSDFTLYANGMEFVSGQSQEVTANVSYTITEDGPDNYSQGSLICRDDSSQQEISHPVTLSLAQSVTCTITNDDDAPKLTLNKILVKDNGGGADEDDWTLNAAGSLQSPTNLSGAGANGDEDVVSGSDFMADTYTLSESGGPDGYTASEWICEGGQQDGDTVTLGIGDEAVCTITNNDNAPSLKLVKEVVNNNGGEAVASEWTLEASGPTTISGNGYAASDNTFSAGTYDLSESDGPDGYESLGWNCEGGILEDSSVTVALGEDVTCTIKNDDQPGSVLVTKFHDLNENGEMDEDEQGLAGWTINLDEDTKETSENGTAEFGNLNADSYELSEDQQDGWQQSGLYCDYGQRDEIRLLDQNEEASERTNSSIRLANGQTLECFIGNHRAPVLGITKTNDNPQAANGETVTYTLIVKVPENGGRIYGLDGEEYTPVTVTDLLPENFVYNGVWTAESNLRDLSAITGDPAYASPGTWILTSPESDFLSPGEEITLTYQAVIGDEVTPGNYPDLAFVRGFNRSGDDVLGEANESQCEDDGPFASSCVEILPAGQVLGATFTTGQVLGLADTGTPLSWMQFIVPSLLIMTTFGVYQATRRQSVKGGKS